MVQSYCKNQQISFSSLAHCAWALLLAHLGGRDDVLFGSIENGRGNLKNATTAVGLFMHLNPIRVKVDEALLCADFVNVFKYNQQQLKQHVAPDPMLL
jgi:non-ribosomal peptide synthetase component F